MAKKDIRTQVKEEFPEFFDSMQSAQSDELNLTLAMLAKGREETQDAKEADEALEQAQITARELAAPYRDAQKAIRLKSKFIVTVLKERGGR